MKTILLIWCGLLLQGFSTADPAQKGRIFLSRDEGDSWLRADAGLPADASISAWTVLSDVVVASTGDNGMYASFDGLKSWRHLYNGLPFDVKIESLTTHHGMLFAGSRKHGVYVSKDAGDTWRRASEGLDEGSVRALYTWHDALYAGTNMGIYRSYNDGQLWSPVANGIQINAFTPASDILFAATNFGALRSTDGMTWSHLSGKEELTTIFADQNMVSSVFSWGNLYTRALNGDAWMSVPSGLNNGLSFRITPASSPLLVARWRSTFKSLRHGSAFRRDGLPEDVGFTQILVTPFGVLIAAGGGGC